MEETDVERLAAQLTRFARLAARAKSMLNVAGIGTEVLLLLFPLREVGPMRVTDLAEVKRVDPSTVSRQAAQLVRAGLARRVADPDDGRASRLEITPAGLDACRQVHEARLAALEGALGAWPPDRVAAFAGLFAEFNSSFEALLHSGSAAPPRENE